MARRSSRNNRIAAVVVLLLASLAVQLMLSGRLFHPDRITVWVFDIGQGDAIFIDAPDAQVLIDGGPDDEILEKLSTVMPFWDRSIDVVINTHPHADHVMGLDYVLERYAVGEVWVSGQEYDSDAFAYFKELEKNEWTLVHAGDDMDLGDGARLDVLWPDIDVEGKILESTHDGNVVTEVTYGNTTILLTGDFEADRERQILDELDHVDVLKVGHHGSETSTSWELLQDITPDYAVISVGEGNDYGHPKPGVLDRLHAIGATILRTDLDGDVRITSDGDEPEVRTFSL